MAVAHPLADTTSFVCCPVQGFPEDGPGTITEQTLQSLSITDLNAYLGIEGKSIPMRPLVHIVYRFGGDTQPQRSTQLRHPR
jgi:hypothetical protein